jgi:RsiW-degrading membrane proteinase PrsW (M82 family)
MTQYVLLTALLPIAVLAFYIYNKDKEKPEPTGLLLKAFFFGVLSVFVSLCISIPLGELGFYPSEPTTIIGGISRAFFAAAIPEEIAKFLMLLLVLRKNSYFDEKIDGILYAVCVSLGFAAFENVMYLFSNVEDFLSVGFTRALFAVPGHFCDGVLMGYYYSKVKFCSDATTKDRVMVLGAPIIVHGLYDAILFVVPVAPYISGLLVIVFLVFCHKMWKYASARIQEYVGK